MKVFDLQCEYGHVFEGWFSNQADFDGQIARGILCCPVCDSPKIHKKLTAARIGRKSNTKPRAQEKPLWVEVEQPPSAAVANPEQNALADIDGAGQKIDPENIQALKAHYLALARHLAKNSEDVGENFADEARRMHAGQAPARAIRGQSNWQQTQQLLEEGIAVLPLPEGVDKPLH